MSWEWLRHSFRARTRSWIQDDCRPHFRAYEHRSRWRKTHSFTIVDNNSETQLTQFKFFVSFCKHIPNVKLPQAFVELKNRIVFLRQPCCINWMSINVNASFNKQQHSIQTTTNYHEIAWHIIDVVRLSPLRLSIWGGSGMGISILPCNSVCKQKLHILDKPTHAMAYDL